MRNNLVFTKQQCIIALLFYLVLVALDVGLSDNPSPFEFLCINPAVGAALIDGAASLIGGFFSSRSSNNSAKYYLQGVRETNEANARENQLNRDYNTQMWNKTNAYNDPLAERQRLEAAGYNPYMKDGSTGATMQSAPSSIPMEAPSQVQPTDYSWLGNAVGSALDAAASVYAIQSDLRSQARADKNQAMQDRLARDSILTGQTQRKLFDTQASLADAQTKEQLRQTAFNRSVESVQRSILDANLELTTRQWKQIQNFLDHYSEELALREFEAYSGRISANASYLGSTTNQARLEHDIDRWVSHNIPGLTDEQKASITRSLYRGVLWQEGIMMQNYDNLDLNNYFLRRDVDWHKKHPRLSNWEFNHRNQRNTTDDLYRFMDFGLRGAQSLGNSVGGIVLGRMLGR